ncbi:MAG: glycosyltransferase family 4 protein [Bacteroidales bacterium]
MKNICFFNTMKFWGGGEKLHLEYAEKFKEKGYNVSLVADHNSPLFERAKNNFDIFHTNGGNLSFLNLIKIQKLVRHYKQSKIDTVVFSSSHDAKLASISASMANIKNIVYLRGLAVPIKSSIVNRYIFNKAITHVVANSEETKRTILQNLKGSFDEKKISVVYHGIDLDIIDKKEITELKEITERKRGQVIIGNAGRLTLQKGQHHLIEIARILKKKKLDFTIFIAGTGDLKSVLEQKIKEYNLEKEVVLLGFVEDIDRFMNSLDIFALTSKWEGFGFVIVEAMAQHKPCVAYNITSNPEIIEKDETGFLVEYADNKAFADKIEQLIKDKELRINMGTKGRQRAERNFQIKNVFDEFEKCLLEK